MGGRRKMVGLGVLLVVGLFSAFFHIRWRLSSLIKDLSSSHQFTSFLTLYESLSSHANLTRKLNNNKN